MKNIDDFFSLLACPDCRGACAEEKGVVVCRLCRRVFGPFNYPLEMLSRNGLPEPKMYSDHDYLKFLSVYDEVLSYHYEQKNLVKAINDRYHRRIHQIFPKEKGCYLDLGCGNGAHWRERERERERANG